MKKIGGSCFSFFFFKGTKFDPFWHDIVCKSTKERKGNITAWMMENNHEERWQSHQRFHQQINKEISSLFVAVSCSRVIIIARGFVRWTPHFYAVDDDVIQTFDQSQIKPPTRKRCQQMAFSNFFFPHTDNRVCTHPHFFFSCLKLVHIRRVNRVLGMGMVH